MFFISPDLSPKERASNKFIHQELRHCKKAGEANLIIRHGKILSKQVVPNLTIVTIVCGCETWLNLNILNSDALPFPYS